MSFPSYGSSTTGVVMLIVHHWMWSFFSQIKCHYGFPLLKWCSSSRCICYIYFHIQYVVLLHWSVYRCLVTLTHIVIVIAPTNTAYKRRCCYSDHKLLCTLYRTFPPPAMEAGFIVFLGKPVMRPAGWLALLFTKADDVETNLGPTTSHKRVWMCDICYKRLHVRKQISKRCNRIELWVHLNLYAQVSAKHRYLDLPSTQRNQARTS